MKTAFLIPLASLVSIALALGASPLPQTGVETQESFRNLADTPLRDFAFHDVSVREIAKTFSALFQMQLKMSEDDDLRIDLPKVEKETVGSGWSRFVAEANKHALKVEGSGKTIHIYRSRKARVEQHTPSQSSNGVQQNLAAGAAERQIVPHFENGKPAGYTIIRITPGSIYDRLGLKNGDVLKAVDGHSLDPDPALYFKALFQRARPTTLTIDLVRDGKPENLTVEVK